MGSVESPPTSPWVSTDQYRLVKKLLRLGKEALKKSTLQIPGVHIVKGTPVCVPLTRVERPPNTRGHQANTTKDYCLSSEINYQ